MALRTSFALAELQYSAPNDTAYRNVSLAFLLRKNNRSLKKTLKKHNVMSKNVVLCRKYVMRKHNSRAKMGFTLSDRKRRQL